MTKYLKLKITVVLCILLAEIVSVGSLVYKRHSDYYVKICRYLNVFNEAMNDFGETLDFRLSELQAMDYLRWYIINNLGFEKANKTYYSDYKVPDKQLPVKYKVEGK